MENLENNVVNNEIQENTEVEAKEVKTFTQCINLFYKFLSTLYM